ncbi:RagB/SusD family nutrient uptake outer membrane protein [Arachidicoccus ginsenosidivorans]|nr:RagB/SusD family nutrient uptake outer membrane protein [Arachidicoccus ginsenosidivorans]
MRKRSNKLSLFVLTGCLLTGLFSCTKDLDKQPTNGVTTAIQYETVAGYKQSLATIYGSLVYTPTSTGSNGFLRDYWNMQEYPTDEAVSTWNDDGNVAIYHQLSWSADLPAVAMVYTDMMNTITLANSFIIESADTKIEARGFDQAAADSVKEFRAEARFMRAYAYSVLMDTYGNPPFATDTTLAAGATPKQIDRKDLFNFIESELMDIAGKLPTPGTNEWDALIKGPTGPYFPESI